jgi:predicted nucleic acid-binding protein
VKPVCCDTSFLFSLYGRDSNTAGALACARTLTAPLTLSVLNQFEFENAIRLSAYRNFIPAADLELMVANFSGELEAGRVVVSPCDLSEVLQEARQLSRLYALAGGFRSFDILIVAVAIHFQARQFLSFDSKQRDLARRAGLKINA